MSPLGIARDCKKDRSIIRDQSCSTTIHLELSPRPQRKGGLLARWFRDDVPQPIGIATAGQAPSVATQSTDRDCKGWSTGTGGACCRDACSRLSSGQLRNANTRSHKAWGPPCQGMPPCLAHAYSTTAVLACWTESCCSLDCKRWRYSLRSSCRGIGHRAASGCVLGDALTACDALIQAA